MMPFHRKLLASAVAAAAVLSTAGSANAWESVPVSSYVPQPSGPGFEPLAMDGRWQLQDHRWFTCAPGATDWEISLTLPNGTVVPYSDTGLPDEATGQQQTSANNQFWQWRLDGEFAVPTGLPMGQYSATLSIMCEDALGSSVTTHTLTNPLPPTSSWQSPAFAVTTMPAPRVAAWLAGFGYPTVDCVDEWARASVHYPGGDPSVDPGQTDAPELAWNESVFYLDDDGDDGTVPVQGGYKMSMDGSFDLPGPLPAGEYWLFIEVFCRTALGGEMLMFTERYYPLIKPGEGDPLATPPQLQPTIVQLGDSYASGQGAGPFEGGYGANGSQPPPSGAPDPNEYWCARSETAPVYVAAEQLGWRGVNLACSGALTKDFLGYQNEAGTSRPVTQLEELAEVAHQPNSNVKVIAISIGGNDSLWTPKLGTCIGAFAFDAWFFWNTSDVGVPKFPAGLSPEPCNELESQADLNGVNGRLRQLIRDTKATMASIVDADGKPRYPDGTYRIILTSYPSPLGDVQPTGTTPNQAAEQNWNSANWSINGLYQTQNQKGFWTLYNERLALGCPVHDAVAEHLMDGSEQIGAIVESAAIAEGVEFLDYRRALDGHRVCENGTIADDWVAPIKLGNLDPASGLPPIVYNGMDPSWRTYVGAGAGLRNWPDDLMSDTEKELLKFPADSLMRNLLLSMVDMRRYTATSMHPNTAGNERLGTCLAQAVKEDIGFGASYGCNNGPGDALTFEPVDDGIEVAPEEPSRVVEYNATTHLPWELWDFDPSDAAYVWAWIDNLEGPPGVDPVPADRPAADFVSCDRLFTFRDFPEPCNSASSMNVVVDIASEEMEFTFEFIDSSGVRIEGHLNVVYRIRTDAYTAAVVPIMPSPINETVLPSTATNDVAQYAINWATVTPTTDPGTGHKTATPFPAELLNVGRNAQHPLWGAGFTRCKWHSVELSPTGPAMSTVATESRQDLDPRSACSLPSSWHGQLEVKVHISSEWTRFDVQPDGTWVPVRVVVNDRRTKDPRIGYGSIGSWVLMGTTLYTDSVSRDTSTSAGNIFVLDVASGAAPVAAPGSALPLPYPSSSAGVVPLQHAWRCGYSTTDGASGLVGSLVRVAPPTCTTWQNWQQISSLQMTSIFMVPAPAPFTFRLAVVSGQWTQPRTFTHQVVVSTSFAGGQAWAVAARTTDGYVPASWDWVCRFTLKSGKVLDTSTGRSDREKCVLPSPYRVADVTSAKAVASFEVLDPTRNLLHVGRGEQSLQLPSTVQVVLDLSGTCAGGYCSLSGGVSATPAAPLGAVWTVSATYYSNGLPVTVSLTAPSFRFSVPVTAGVVTVTAQVTWTQGGIVYTGEAIELFDPSGWR